MKKIVALFLAALMLLSAVAFAADSNATLTVGGNKYTYKNAKGVAGDVKTDIYIQVKNEGQIDVTVPLFLVFSTNVDGGNASAPSGYTIKNNNTKTSVGIDKIVAENISDGGLTLVAAGTTLTTLRDSYTVTLKPTYTATAIKDKGLDTYDMKSATGTTYDATSKTDECLFKLLEGASITIEPEMKTSSLTFVGGDATAKTGIKVMSISYTVGLVYKSVTPAALPTADITMPTPTPGH